MTDKLTPRQRTFLKVDPDRRMELRYIIEAQNIAPNFCANEHKLLGYMEAAGRKCDTIGQADAGIVRRMDGEFREYHRTADGSGTFYTNNRTQLLTLGTGDRRDAAKESIRL